MGRPSFQNEIPIGSIFGKFIVIGYSKKPNGSKVISCAEVKCVCGNVRLVRFSDLLRTGKPHHSCGCTKISNIKEKLSISKESFESKIPNGIAGDYQSYLNRNSNKGKSLFFDHEFGSFYSHPYNVFCGKSRHPKRTKIAKEYMGLSQRMRIEDVKDKLPIDVIIYEDTYISVNRKAKFYHAEIGDWYSYVYRVIEGHLGGGIGRKITTTRTCMAKYGVPHPSQDHNIARKTAKSFAKSVNFHWKTNEELECQSGWEHKVIDYLNNNKIDFLWQPKTFQLSKNSYRPDFYLVQEDMWIEIKGYARQLFQDKWKEFIALQPNCEIWDLTKLKQLGIL